MKKSLWLVLFVLGSIAILGVVLVSFFDTEKFATAGAKSSYLAPHIIERAQDIESIHIEVPTSDGLSDENSGSGTATELLRFWNDGEFWRVREHHDYFVDAGALSALIIALGEANFIEPKTSIKNNHERLGLGAPADGGSATLVSFYSDALAETDPIDSVLLGEEARSRSGTYVRRFNEDQTWLTIPALERLSARADTWLRKSFLNIAASKVRSITFDADGEEYVLNRAIASESFVTDIPEGYEVADKNKLNDWAKLLEQLEFIDVYPNNDPRLTEFDEIAKAIVTTFDGLKITIQTGYNADVPNDMARFTFEVDDIAAAADIYDKAEHYTALYTGWSFLLEESVLSGFQFDSVATFSEIEQATDDDSDK